MSQIKMFGQGKQIQQVQDAYTKAAADGQITKEEFKKIASEMNDVWKLNRIDLMDWLGDRDPGIREALRYGQAAMSADVGFSHYVPPQD